MATPPITITEISANGFTFQCRTCGLENSGEPVILLHGFPETSHMWTEMMKSLASRGYRCLAPNQRGYSSGARPKAVSDYRIDTIASDVLALADHVGFSKFHLVAHDWGAGCGWTVVQQYPERVQSWTSLSIPHLAAFEHAKQTDPEQKKKSWYMGFFQLPILPELVFGLITKMPSLFWSHSGPEEQADYSRVFRSFDARKAPLHWYRANNTLPIQYGEVNCPTLLIWGTQDVAVGRAGIDATEAYIKGRYTKIELEAGHSLIQEKFDAIEQEILRHLQVNSFQKA